MTGSTSSEALTRSRIEHWLRNRNLMFYDVGGVGIGFGPTVEEDLTVSRTYFFCSVCNRWAYFDSCESKDGEPALRCGKCGHVSVIPDARRPV